jgi:hypothetical protein
VRVGILININEHELEGSRVLARSWVVRAMEASGG